MVDNLHLLVAVLHTSLPHTLQHFSGKKVKSSTAALFFTVKNGTLCAFALPIYALSDSTFTGNQP